jgi:hypothetical protein
MRPREANPLIFLHFHSLRRGVPAVIALARFGTELREPLHTGLKDLTSNHINSLAEGRFWGRPRTRVGAPKGLLG